MKKLLTILFLFCFGKSFPQLIIRDDRVNMTGRLAVGSNPSINTIPTNVHIMVGDSATTRAFLGPRVQRLADIPSPRQGMLIYCIDSLKYFYHNGTSWVAWGGAGGGLGVLDIVANPKYNVTIDYGGVVRKSHAPIRRWNVKDLGAVGDSTTNDTYHLQRAIDSAVLNLGGQIIIPAGRYRVDSLTIPAYSGPEPILIEIIGEMPPAFLFGTVTYNYTFPKSGSIILSNATSATGSVIRALSTGVAYGFSFAQITIKNIQVQTYENPNISGIDLGYTGFARLDNVFINTRKYCVTTAEPTNNKFGLKMPRSNNGAYSIIENVTISGFDSLLIAYEHTSANNINLYGGKFGS